MDHDLELFIPILEILEIEVCNILCKPGNIGKHIFQLSPILEIVDRTIHISVLSWKYWIVRSILSPILEILEIEVFNILPNPGNIGNWIFPISPYPGNIGNMFFSIFWDFSKKDARRNFTQNPPINEPRSLICVRLRARN